MIFDYKFFSSCRMLRYVSDEDRILTRFVFRNDLSIIFVTEINSVVSHI